MAQSESGGNDKQSFARMPSTASRFFPSRDELSQQAGNLTAAVVMPKSEYDPDVEKDIKKIHLSLREAILIALRYNPDVTNAEIDRLSQKYNLRLAQWGFEWQYGLEGSVGLNNARANGRNLGTKTNYSVTPTLSKKLKTGTELSLDFDNHQNGIYYSPSATLKLEQPLLRGAPSAVVTKELDDAYDDEIINRLNLKKSIIATIKKIILDYRSLVQANNNVEITKRSLHDAEKTYENNAVQIRLGKLPRTDNITQKAQVESLRLQVTQAINAQNRNRQQLVLDMGLDPDTQVTIPNDISIELTPIPTLSETVNYALKNNMDYLANLVSYKKDKRVLMKAKDDMRWQLNLTAQASVGDGTGTRTDTGFNGIFNGRNHTESVGLNLKVPINDVALKAGLVRAKVSLQQAQTNLQQNRRLLITNIKNLITDLKSQRLQVQISEQAVKLKQQDYELQKKKQQLGKGTSLDVTNSQNALISAKTELINNKITYLNTVSELREILGTTLTNWDVKIRY